MIRALIIMIEVNYSLKWPFTSCNYFSFVQHELVAGPSLCHTERTGHSSSAALLAPGGSVSAAGRGEVWLPEPSWFSISFSSGYLVTQWPDSISGDGLESVIPHQGCQVVHLRFKKKKKRFESGIRIGWVSALRRLASAECKVQIVAFFTAILYIYLFLLLWLFLLTWLLQG